jgi:hypothetical protein
MARRSLRLQELPPEYDALGVQAHISSRLRQRPPPPPAAHAVGPSDSSALDSLSTSSSSSPLSASSTSSWGGSDSPSADDLSPSGQHPWLAVRDVDGFAGVFQIEADVSEIKGISDRIAICGRAMNGVHNRGLIDCHYFKQFGIANPDRMQGVRRSLALNPNNPSH